MNIIVNGGTRGIGREIVIKLAHDNSNQIIVTGRNEKALNRLSSKYKNVRSYCLDMSRFDSQCESFMATINEHFTRVDILINNAGLLISRDFLEMNNADARLIMETNFFGPASLIRVLKPMMPSGSHIVNIASMGGFQGSSKYKGLSY
jgi:NAD(P)-dependent dehydrogenase (short-subunit alcohol dehydrogenase family)